MKPGILRLLAIGMGLALILTPKPIISGTANPVQPKVYRQKLPPPPGPLETTSPKSVTGPHAPEILVLTDRSKNWVTRLTALNKLGRSADPGILPYLVGALEDDSVFIRCNAAMILGTRSEKSAEPALKKALEDPGVLLFDDKQSKAVARAAQWALAKIHDPSVEAPDNLCSGSSMASHNIAGDIRILEDPGKNSAERAMAANRLGWTLNPEKAAPALKSHLDEKDNLVRSAVVEALGILGHKPFTDELMRILKTDPNWTVRKAAVGAVARVNPPGALEALAHVLAGDETILVRMAAAEALGEMGDRRALPYLKDALSDSELMTNIDADGNQRVFKGVAEKASQSLEKLGEKVKKVEIEVDWLAESVKTLSTSTDYKKRAEAVTRMGRAKDPGQVLPHLFKAAKTDLSPNVRRGAAFALANLKDDSALPVLHQMLSTDPDKWVRFSAAKALGMLADHRSVRALRTAAETDPFFQVKKAAQKALDKIGAPTGEQKAKPDSTQDASVEIIPVSIGKDKFAPTKMKLRIGGRQTIQLFQAPPFEVKKEPPGNGQERLYGQFELGDGKQKTFGFLVHGITQSHPPVFFDVNQNGDFTDDGGPLKNASKNPFGASVYIPFERLLPESGLAGKYRSWLWTTDKALASRQAFRYSWTQLEGKVEIGGQIYTAVIPDSGEHDGDYTNDGIGLDLNGDGKIFYKTEYARPGKTLKIKDRLYKFQVRW